MNILQKGMVWGAVLLGMSSLTPAAQASGTWVTNEAAFLAAISGTLTDTYSGLNGFYAGPLIRLSGKLGAAANGGLYASVVSGTTILSTNNPVALSLSSTGLDSIGGNFNLTDINFNPLAGTMTFEIYNGATLVSSTTHNLSTPGNFFMGYVGDPSNSNPILKITPQNLSTSAYAGTAKMYLGTAVPTGGAAVPEPGEWAAMGILAGGLAGLVIKRRKQV